MDRTDDDDEDVTTDGSGGGGGVGSHDLDNFSGLGQPSYIIRAKDHEDDREDEDDVVPVDEDGGIVVG